MARIRCLSEADLAPADRELLARKPNLYRALAHSPDVRALRTPALYVRHHSTLAARLRELAIIQLPPTQLRAARHSAGVRPVVQSDPRILR